ncbi:MAG TPA: ester cyclase [Candidatus Nitrosotenuis sp.]|nr:ester cyclase [Candidatus Nitrosotenuis sp.]
MPTEVRELVQELIDAWNARDPERVLACYHPDVEVWDPSLAEPVRGLEALRQWLAAYWRAFPDMGFEVHQIVMEGDRAALQWTACATHQGPLGPLPPTGRAVRFVGTSFLQLRQGRVEKASYLWDQMALLQALGALPPGS